MSCIQSKITKHAKKLKNRTHQEKKRQSIENDPELTNILELSNRNIKTVIIVLFCIFQKLSRDMGCV